MSIVTRVRALAFGSGALLAIALLTGRLSGLIRELLLASRFGVSPQADVAVVLLTLPDLLINLLISGGLSAALVPRLRAASAGQAAQMFRRVSLWAALAFGAMALVVGLWPDAVFTLLAPGLRHPARLTGDTAFALVALSIPLTALSGVTAAYLNAGDRYFIVGTGTLIFNLAVIGALAGRGGDDGIVILAAAILAGAVLRLGSQVAALPRHIWRSTAGEVQLDARFRRAFAAGALAASLALLPPAIVRAAASLLAPGNIATFNYAQKLVELPLGILITTISTIALTRLSGHHAQGDHRAARHTLNANLRLSLLLALLIVASGEILIDRVVALLFLRGAIDADSAARIAALARVALLGVPFVAVSSLAMAALNAQLRTPEVLRATGLSLAALVVLTLPGLILHTETLLMAAVVGSQAVLATLLVRKAGICLGGGDGVGSPRFLVAAAFGIAIALSFGAAAVLLPPDHNIAAVGVGGIGFAIALAGAVMFLKDEMQG